MRKLLPIATCSVVLLASCKARTSASDVQAFQFDGEGQKLVLGVTDGKVGVRACSEDEYYAVLEQQVEKKLPQPQFNLQVCTQTAAQYPPAGDVPLDYYRQTLVESLDLQDIEALRDAIRIEIVYVNNILGDHRNNKDRLAMPRRNGNYIDTVINFEGANVELEKTKLTALRVFEDDARQRVIDIRGVASQVVETQRNAMLETATRIDTTLGELEKKWFTEVQYKWILQHLIPVDGKEPSNLSVPAQIKAFQVALDPILRYKDRLSREEAAKKFTVSDKQQLDLIAAIEMCEGGRARLPLHHELNEAGIATDSPVWVADSMRMIGSQLYYAYVEAGKLTVKSTTSADTGMKAVAYCVAADGTVLPTSSSIKQAMQ